MTYYSPKENARRVREGLAALLAGRAMDFGPADQFMIVVFEGEPSQLGTGRILLFQQFFLNQTGVLPMVVKKVPACIKVFFDVDGADRETVGKVVHEGGNPTPDFQALCRDLRISYVQLGGTIIRLEALK